MTRHAFGGGIADYVLKYEADGVLQLAANAQVTFWNAATEGAQLTDLLDTTGQPILDGVVTADGNGAIPPFGQGPEGVRAMWASAAADGQGPRRLMLASDSADELGDIQGRLLQIEEKLAGVGAITVAPTAPAAPAIGDVWIDTSPPAGSEPLAFRAASGVAGTYGPNLSCALPNGLAAGDYLVSIIVINSDVGQTVAAVPAGWTELVAPVLTGGDTRVAVYGTVYATGQPAPAWTFTADAKATAALAGYANADPQVQIGAVYERPGSSAQIEAPSITTADPDMLIVCAFGEKSSAATSITEPEGTELRIAQLGFNTNAVPSALLCDFAQPVPGATGTRIATYNAMSNNGLGVQIGLRPRSA